MRKNETVLYVVWMDLTTIEEHTIRREIKINERYEKQFSKETAIGKNFQETKKSLIKGRSLRVGRRVFGMRGTNHIALCFKCLKYGHRSRDCQINKPKQRMSEMWTQW